MRSWAGRKISLATSTEHQPSRQLPRHAQAHAESFHDLEDLAAGGRRFLGCVPRATDDVPAATDTPIPWPLTASAWPGGGIMAPSRDAFGFLASRKAGVCQLVFSTSTHY